MYKLSYELVQSKVWESVNVCVLFADCKVYLYASAASRASAGWVEWKGQIVAALLYSKSYYKTTKQGFIWNKNPLCGFTFKTGIFTVSLK